MSDVHARYLKIEVTADESDDTLLVTAVEYFRTKQDYVADTNAYTVPCGTHTAAAEPVITFGTVLPPPTHIAIESTFQA